VNKYSTRTALAIVIAAAVLGGSQSSAEGEGNWPFSSTRAVVSDTNHKAA
jgi:hypothetical protein